MITSLGNLNGDDVVDSEDLTLLALYVARINDSFTPAQLAAADVTKDGTVDAADLTTLARYVAKIISEF